MKRIVFILLATCLVYCHKKKDDPAPEEEKTVYLSRPTAFFASKSNLYAIDADSGTLIWKQSASVYDGDERHTTATYSNGIVYLEQSNNLTAYDAITGTPQWYTPNEGGFSPTVKNGNVYISNDWGDTYSIDKKTGTINWSVKGNRRSITDAISCSPYVKDSVLYCGNRESTLFAINANTGAYKWSFGSIYARERLICRPVVENGVVYCRTNGGLLAVNAADGTEKWRVKFTISLIDFSYSNPTLSNGVLYATSYDKLYSISTPDGKINWAFDADETGRYYTCPAVWNNLVFIIVYSDWTRPSFIYAVDINTGQQVWKYKSNHPFYKSATIYNGNLYIGSQAGMQVFDPASGTLKWTFTPDNNEAVATGVCIVDTKNKIYTVSNSGDYE